MGLLAQFPAPLKGLRPFGRKSRAQPAFSGARGTARPAPTGPADGGQRGAAPWWGTSRSSEAESGGGTGRGGGGEKGCRGAEFAGHSGHPHRTPK
ncbi:hypothetical protein CVT30_15120 [Streptomyces sp. AMCC400023]|nr:hypothetical protein CVT30_15120 [Streptomyces sp. AMCC400023]